MKRQEPQEERVARKRARHLAAFEERERRDRIRSRARYVDKVASHFERKDAQGMIGHEYGPVDPKRL